MRNSAESFLRASFGGRIFGFVVGIYGVGYYDSGVLFLITMIGVGIGIDYYIMYVAGPMRRSKLFRQSLSVDIISLCAKMCKAKGMVNKDDILMCDRFFEVEPEHRSIVSMVFNQARTTVSGYDHLASRIFNGVGGNRNELENIMKVLYSIAYTDEKIDERERIFLLRVADIFDFSPSRLSAIETELGIGSHASGSWQQQKTNSGNVNHKIGESPYIVLGVSSKSSIEDVKRAYRKLVAAHHPDKLHGNGASETEIKKAEDKMATINSAYNEIMRNS